MSKKSKYMRVVCVDPLKQAYVKQIDNSLSGMQAEVGGYIQAIYPFNDPVALVCNDEGKLQNLLPNRALKMPDGTVYDIVFGSFFICLAKPGSDYFESLTDELTKKYLELYKYAEVHICVDGKIHILRAGIVNGEECLLPE